MCGKARGEEAVISYGAFPGKICSSGDEAPGEGLGLNLSMGRQALLPPRLQFFLAKRGSAFLNNGDSLTRQDSIE